MDEGRKLRLLLPLSGAEESSLPEVTSSSAVHFLFSVLGLLLGWGAGRH